MLKYTEESLKSQEMLLSAYKHMNEDVQKFETTSIKDFRKAFTDFLNKTIESNEAKISAVLSANVENIPQSYSVLTACQAAINVCRDLSTYMNDTKKIIDRNKDAISDINKKITEIKLHLGETE